MNHIPLQVPEGMEIDDTDLEVLVDDDAIENTEDQDTAVDPPDEFYADEDGEEGTSESTASSRPGIDDIKRHLRETMGEHAEGVVNALLRDDTVVKQAEADRRRLRDAIDEVEELRESFEEEESDFEDPTQEALNNVPPEQIELLEAWMKNQGYIKQDDLTERDKEEYVWNSNIEGVEMFGEDFGHFDGEDFVLNGDAQESMAPIYERVVDHQNLDYRDLYVLGNFPALLESAKVQGRNETIEEIRQANSDRVGNAQRGTVISRNPGGSASRQLYDRNEYSENGGAKRGGWNRISDVLEKARRAATSA